MGGGSSNQRNQSPQPRRGDRALQRVDDDVTYHVVRPVSTNGVWCVFPGDRTAGDKIRVQYEGKSFDVTLPGGVAVGQPFEITGLLNAPQSKGQVEAEEDQAAIDNSLQTAADEGVAAVRGAMRGAQEDLELQRALAAIAEQESTESETLVAAVRGAQETQLILDFIATKEASEAEARRRAEEERAEEEQLRRALAESARESGELQELQQGRLMGMNDEQSLGAGVFPRKELALAQSQYKAAHRQADAAPLTHDSTSLMRAARCGDARGVSELMRQLIQEVAGRPDVPLFDRDEEGRTPLMMAAKGGYLDCVELLLMGRFAEAKNARDDDGWTAVMHAACNGHVSCLRAMLNAGADVGLKNQDGKTALDLAEELRGMGSQQDHDEVARVLAMRISVAGLAHASVGSMSNSSAEAEIAALESEIAGLEGRCSIEDTHKLDAKEEARRAAEEEAARVAAIKTAREQARAQAKARAEAEAAEASAREAEEEAQRHAEEEARKAAREQARAEAKARAEAEAAEEARREAEEEEAHAAAADVRRAARAEARARREAEAAEAQRAIAEEARQEEESLAATAKAAREQVRAEAKAKAEAEEARQEAEEEARLAEEEAEREARRAARAQAQADAKAQAEAEAAEEAAREAEEEARRHAEAEERRAAREQARAEARAKAEAEEAEAQRQAEAEAQREAEAAAKRERERKLDNGPQLTPGVIQYDELQIGDILGSGTYGVVHMGLWKGDGVAVKQIRSDRVEDRQGAKKAFMAELSLMTKLRHRHIVNCYGGSCDPELVLVMELMERGSLSECMRDHRDEFAWARLGKKILLDAAKGMLYLHSFTPPIVHFDIKPLNVLISADNTGKLADVGLTRQMMATVTMPQGWTPNYAAPEVLQRLGANEKSDVYSFGAMIWEVFTGKTPSPFNALVVEPGWPVAQLLQGSGSSDRGGALASDKDRRCSATQLKDELTKARASEPRELGPQTVGADTCDMMLNGLGELNQSMVAGTAQPTQQDGSQTEALLQQLLAVKEIMPPRAPAAPPLATMPRALAAPPGPDSEWSVAAAAAAAAAQRLAASPPPAPLVRWQQAQAAAQRAVDAEAARMGAGGGAGAGAGAGAGSTRGRTGLASAASAADFFADAPWRKGEL